MAQMNKSTFPVVAIFLIALLETGYGLTCFDCVDMDNDNQCTKVLNQQKCNVEDVCIFVEILPHSYLSNNIGNISMPSMRIKSCGSRHYCKLSADFVQKCRTCDTDLCNSE